MFDPEEKRGKLQQQQQQQQQQQLPTGPKFNSRYIPSSLRQELYFKYGGKCAYVNPLTHKRCESQYQLQIDHVLAYSKGGTSALNNLQLLCRNHNTWKSDRLV